MCNVNIYAAAALAYFLTCSQTIGIVSADTQCLQLAAMTNNDKETHYHHHHHHRNQHLASQ
jgi:hypothetical protein